MTRRLAWLVVLVGTFGVGCGGAAPSSSRPTYRDVTAGPVPVGAPMTGLSASAGPSSGGSVGYGGYRRSFDGLAGGPIEAMSWDSSCRGWIPETPQIQLDLPSPTTLVMAGTSDVDTTMVAVFPDGHIACNDDTNGLNPQLSGEFPAGHYRIYIGTYSQSDGMARFHVEVGP